MEILGVQIVDLGPYNRDLGALATLLGSMNPCPPPIATHGLQHLWYDAKVKQEAGSFFSQWDDILVTMSVPKMPYHAEFEHLTNFTAKLILATHTYL